MYMYVLLSNIGYPRLQGYKCVYHKICPEGTVMLKDGQNNETIEYTKTISQLMTNDIHEYNLLFM